MAKERGIDGGCKDTNDLTTQGVDAIPEQKGLWKPGMMPRSQVLATDRIAALVHKGKQRRTHSRVAICQA